MGRLDWLGLLLVVHVEPEIVTFLVNVVFRGLIMRAQSLVSANFDDDKPFYWTVAPDPPRLFNTGQMGEQMCMPMISGRHEPSIVRWNGIYVVPLPGPIFVG